MKLSDIFKTKKVEEKQYKPGDHIVYPRHGVLEIKRIDRKEVGGKAKLFYVMRCLNNEMTIIVPCDNVQKDGARDLMTKETALKVLKRIETRRAPPEGTWNKRYRELMYQINSGDLDQLVDAIISLESLKSADKELSFGERKLLDMARTLLTQETNLVLQK